MTRLLNGAQWGRSSVEERDGAQGRVLRGPQSQVHPGPDVGTQVLFILQDTALTSTERRGWGGRGDDPCHPLSGPTSMRMPMRMSPKRRAGSGAPPCDPCLPVGPSLEPRCLRCSTHHPSCSFSVWESAVRGRLFQPHTAHLRWNGHQPKSELRLCPGLGLSYDPMGKL